MTTLFNNNAILRNATPPIPERWTDTPVPVAKARNFLRFPPEAEIVINAFKYETLNQIFWIAEDLSPGPIISANVSLYSSPSGETRGKLTLILEIGADWDGIDKLEDSIIKKVIAWAEDWSDEEWSDYSEQMHFVLIPTSL